MKLNQSILMSLVAITLVSCSSTTYVVSETPNSIPDIGIPLDDRYLAIAVPQGWNTFKTDRPISLMLRDISDQQIVVNQGTGIRIFVWAVNKWVEVKNKMSYTSTEIVLVPDANSDPAKIGGMFLLPDLADYPGSSKIRVFIIGKLKSGEQFASYIDVTLNR